jgi:Right handed beta helix region
MGSPFKALVKVSCWSTILLGLPLGAQTVPGVANARTLPGNGDLGAKINSYFSSCSYACTVYLPPGTYTYSTTITIAPPAFATYRLIGEKGTVLKYSGPGDGIFVTTNHVAQVGVANLQISGFQLLGTSSGVDGIRIQPTNGVSIDQMLISGFTAGSGIWLEGPNSMSIQNSIVINNQYGIMAESTFCSRAAPYACSPTGPGIEYDPNAVHIHDNYIAANGKWGIFLQTPSGHGIARSNIVASNVLENNGSAGPIYGDIFMSRDQGTVIEGNYFEASPRHIVLGTKGSGPVSQSSGDHITGNYFNSAKTAPYNIELEDARWTVIDANNDYYVSGKICEIHTPGAGDEYGTVVGLNGFTTGNYLTCVGAGTSPAYLPGANSFTQPVTQSVTFGGCRIPAGSIGTICIASGQWPAPFAGTPASVVCSMASAGDGANTVGALTGISKSGVNVQEISLSTTAAGGGSVTCRGEWSSN